MWEVLSVSSGNRCSWQTKTKERVRAGRLRSGMECATDRGRAGVSVSSVSVWVRDLVPVDLRRTCPTKREIEPPADPAGNARRCGRCGQLATDLRAPSPGDDDQWRCREGSEADLQRGATWIVSKRTPPRSAAGGRREPIVIGDPAMHPCVDRAGRPGRPRIDHLAEVGAHGQAVETATRSKRSRQEIEHAPGRLRELSPQADRREGSSGGRIDSQSERNRTLLPSELRNSGAVRDVASAIGLHRLWAGRPSPSSSSTTWGTRELRARGPPWMKSHRD